MTAFRKDRQKLKLNLAKQEPSTNNTAPVAVQRSREMLELGEGEAKTGCLAGIAAV